MCNNTLVKCNNINSGNSLAIFIISGLLMAISFIMMCVFICSKPKYLQFEIDKLNNNNKDSDLELDSESDDNLIII